MKQRALQGNAADDKQVAFAARADRDRQEIFRASLVAVMGTPEGRAFVWGLLEQAGIYQSTFSESGSRTFYNAGRRDFGLELLALTVDYAEDGYLEMEREARQRARVVNRSAEAVQAAAGKATTEESNDGGN